MADAVSAEYGENSISTFCPATMCPLFAKDGSPWTGDKDTPCEREACGWFHEGSCSAAGAAYDQVGEVDLLGRAPLQIGPVTARRVEEKAPRTFDCPRAAECQWQQQAGDQLCPPRHALSLGLDPRTCAW